MILAIILLLIVILSITILLFLSNKNLKIYLCVISIIIVLSTLFVCIKIPKVHKVISFQFINYLIKFENSGDVSITKQTTSTVYKKQGDTNKWKNG